MVGFFLRLLAKFRSKPLINDFHMLHFSQINKEVLR